MYLTQIKSTYLFILLLITIISIFFIYASKEKQSTKKSEPTLGKSDIHQIIPKLEEQFPAPAKKIHRLLSDSKLTVVGNAALTERSRQLDQLLITLKQQLKDQNIKYPKQDTAQNQLDNSIAVSAIRLQRIKSHLARQ